MTWTGQRGSRTTAQGGGLQGKITGMFGRATLIVGRGSPDRGLDRVLFKQYGF